MENTESEFGNMKIYICRFYQEWKGFVSCSATESVWTSSNQINVVVRSVSFILILFPRGGMTRSQIVCSIFFEATLIMTCLQLSS